MAPAAAILDPDRLAAVRATGLLDAAAAEWADDLTGLAARLLDAPLAFLTLVDDERSFWFSCTGVGPDGPRQNTADESFCQYVITDRAPLIVGDATAHPRTRDNPSVASMGVRAWAGYPLLDPQGNALGSFCVVDTVARTWSHADVETLGVLARAASGQLALLGVVGAEQAAAERLGSLAGVALALVGAELVEDLAEVVVERGLAVLGADGGTVIVREPDGFRVVIGEEPGTTRPTALLPLDHPLPGPEVARTGQRVVIPNRAAGLAHSPAMAQVYAQSPRHAWVVEPLRLGHRTLGSLVVSWQEERTFSDDDLDLIEALAAQCSQALERIQVTLAQRAATVDLYDLAESLQRSLLTEPPTPTGLDVAVRYLPASHAAQVGGDWHDAFVCDDGSTMLTIGDVCGHDRIAAATMAQVRNLLRGLAMQGAADPSVVLSRLDRAMDRLGIDTFTTAAVVQVTDGPAGPRIAWSSAGHLPILLRTPDGRVRAVEGVADLPLAVQPAGERHVHHADLPSGSLLVLCTDGLVERRTEGIGDGLERLRAALAEHHDIDAGACCDRLLTAMLPAPPEDDVAILVLRVA